MSTLNRLAKETVIYGLSHVLPRILHFGVMTIYLTHRFNENTIDYGIYSDLYAYATIILAFMVFRMDTAYFRFGSKAENKDVVLSTTMVPIIVIGGLFCLSMVLFSQEIANLLNYPDQPYYVEWFAYILGLDALSSLIYAKFRLANRPFRFLFFRVANVVITVIFVMLFLEILPRFAPGFLNTIYLKLGLQRELDFVFLSNLIASLMVFVMMLPEILRTKWAIDPALLKKILKYSWPLVIVAIAGSMNQSLALILQKYWLGGSLEENQAMVGIFSAGAKLAILLNLFTTAFNYAAEPFFFNNAAKEKSISIYGEVALAYTIFACLVVLGTYLFIDIVMSLIGSSYREGIIVVPILLIAYVFLGLYYMVAIWYKLSDKTMAGAWVSIIGVVITFSFSYFLIPSLGIVGSAWTALICFSSMVLICYQWGRSNYPINYPWKKIIILISITSFIIFISYVIRQLLASNLIALYSINVLLFILSVSWIYFSEKKFITNMFNRRS